MGRASGSQTTQVAVPKWQEDAAQAALARANQVAGIGYTPYYGPDVAAMTPLQMSAMQGTDMAASAFGMPTANLSAGMPPAQDFGGMQGYSSGPLYDQAIAELRARNPAQYRELQSEFVQPAMRRPSVPVRQPAVPTPRTESSQPKKKKKKKLKGNTSSNQSGGFKSVRDMFDGGGAGKSGDTFKGGPLSNKLNRAGVKPVAAR